MTVTQIHPVPTTTKNIRGLKSRRRAIHPSIKAAVKAAPTAALGTVIGVLLCLSLGHLARGIELLTHWSASEALAMAIGLDLLIVSLEVVEVYTAATTPKTHKNVTKWSHPALFIAFFWSAGLNSFAAFDVTSLVPTVALNVIAALLGLFIPVLIYLATRAWAATAIPAKAATSTKKR